MKKEDRPQGATAHWYYCLRSGDQVVVEYQTLVGTTFPPGTQPEQAATTDTPSDLRYAHWDLRSVRLVTDGNGNEVDTQSHTAYGEEMDGGEEVPPFFTTYDREVTELDYARARYYRWDHRRFTSPDTYRGSYRSGSPQSLNRYAYVANDPINRVDPSGLLQVLPRARWEDLPINDTGPPSPPPVNPPPSPCIADENGECPPPSGGGDPFEAAYNKCRKQVFGDANTFEGRAVPSLEAAMLIWGVSAYGSDGQGHAWSNADPVAIATIWAQESGFNLYPGRHENPNGTFDWGPLQINDVRLNDPNWWSRYVPESVGGNPCDPRTNPLCNLIAGARDIAAHGGAVGNVNVRQFVSSWNSNPDYVREAMARYEKYKELFDCIKKELGG